MSHPPSGDHTSDMEAIQIRPDSKQISVLLNLTLLAKQHKHDTSRHAERATKENEMIRVRNQTTPTDDLQ